MRFLTIHIYIITFILSFSGDIFSKDFDLKIRLTFCENKGEVIVKNSKGLLLNIGSKALICIPSISLKKKDKIYILNDSVIISDKIQISSKYSDDTLQISTKYFSRKYYGKLNILNNRNIAYLILNTTIDYYIISCLASETNSTDPIEMKKVLSIIMNNNSKYNKHTGIYSFCDNTHCQLFYGNEKISMNDIKAFEETKYINLLCNEKNSFIKFTGCCGGICNKYENIIENCTVPVKCTWCSFHPFFNWNRVISINKILPILSTNNIKINIGEKDNFIKFTDKKSNQSITKENFRIKYGRMYGWNTILSNEYSIKKEGYMIKFFGKGFGSTNGLCMAGSITLAKKGQSFKEIISYYFPNFKLYESKNKKY